MGTSSSIENRGHLGARDIKNPYFYLLWRSSVNDDICVFIPVSSAVCLSSFSCNCSNFILSHFNKNTVSAKKQKVFFIYLLNIINLLVFLKIVLREGC